MLALELNISVIIVKTSDYVEVRNKLLALSGPAAKTPPGGARHSQDRQKVFPHFFTIDSPLTHSPTVGSFPKGIFLQ